MKQILNIVTYIGFLFFGGGFLYSFGMFVAYNGIGKVFDYERADEFQISGDTVSLPAKLLYRYAVDGKEYEDYQNVSDETARSAETAQLTVLYNPIFKNLSMIKELKKRETKAWDYTVGMIVFGSFFLLILLLYKLANIDKWVKIYSGKKYIR